MRIRYLLRETGILMSTPPMVSEVARVILEWEDGRRVSLTPDEWALIRVHMSM